MLSTFRSKPSFPCRCPGGMCPCRRLHSGNHHPHRRPNSRPPYSRTACRCCPTHRPCPLPYCHRPHNAPTREPSETISMIDWSSSTIGAPCRQRNQRTSKTVSWSAFEVVAHEGRSHPRSRLLGSGVVALELVRRAMPEQLWPFTRLEK